MSKSSRKKSYVRRSHSSLKKSKNNIKNILERLGSPKKQKSRAISATNRKKKEFEILQEPEPGNMTLKEHQIRVLDALKKRRGLLVVHSTGTGKTLTAVVASRFYLKTYPDRKVIVITPVSLQENFKKELIAYGVTDFSKYEFYTYQGFANAVKSDSIECEKSMMIIDEAHNLKLQSGTIALAVISCSKRADRVVLLTATPIINKPVDIKNLLTILDGYRTDDVLFDESGLNIANDDILKKNFLCKLSFYSPTQDEIYDYYPRYQIHDIFLPMSPSYYANYRAVENNIRANQTILELFGSKSNLKTFFNGVRRAANNLEKENSPKINWVMEKIAQSKSWEKFVIFSHFLEAGMNLVKKRLDDVGIEYGYIDGQMPMKKRKEIVEKYNQNQIKILLISEAGGEGLDLKETRFLIIIEPDWNENNLNQVIGRAIRYNSHSSLPSFMRRVDVYKLYMVKPREFQQDILERILQNPEITKYAGEILSVDLYLRNFSFTKQEVINDYIQKIQKYSIENNDCK